MNASTVARAVLDFFAGESNRWTDRAAATNGWGVAVEPWHLDARRWSVWGATTMLAPKHEHTQWVEALGNAIAKLHPPRPSIDDWESHYCGNFSKVVSDLECIAAEPN